jgi:hypothetical protein
MAGDCPVHIRQGRGLSGAYPTGQGTVRCISDRAGDCPVLIRQGRGLSGAYPTGQGTVRCISDSAGDCPVHIRQCRGLSGAYPTRHVRYISDRGREQFGTNPTGQMTQSGAYPTGNVRYISDRAGSCSVQSDRAGVCPLHIRQEICKGVPFNFFEALFYLNTCMCIKLTGVNTGMFRGSFLIGILLHRGRMREVVRGGGGRGGDGRQLTTK